MAEIQLDNVGITLFECSRKEVTATRKFLADCGVKLIARVSGGGKVTITADDELHTKCKACEIKKEFIRTLIKSGK